MTIQKSIFRFTFSFLLFTLFIANISCDSDTDSGDILEDEDASIPCNDLADFIFLEENNFINIEFENTIFNEGWELVNSTNNVTGEGYMVWNGEQHLREPSTDLATYTIRIQNPGTYRFIWRSAVTIGDSGTDHNDTWLRFADADDYFGQQNERSRIFPRGTGKTPNPEGASEDGWFKIFRSGSNLDFRWQSSTSDNDAHNVFVSFDNPGDYTMEISARSSGHGIDRFILFQEASFTMQEAISDTNTLSAITCKQ